MQEKKEEDLQQALNKVSEVGIDEVGRGAIFGPVFSAVVVLNEKNEIVFIDKKDDIELTDELNNARKKRRRSSASIE